MYLEKVARLEDIGIKDPPDPPGDDGALEKVLNNIEVREARYHESIAGQQTKDTIEEVDTKVTDSLVHGMPDHAVTTPGKDNTKLFRSAEGCLKEAVCLDGGGYVCSLCVNNGINWRFITETEPWMEGFYERSVREAEADERSLVVKWRRTPWRCRKSHQKYRRPILRLSRLNQKHDQLDWLLPLRGRRHASSSSPITSTTPTHRSVE